MNGQARDVVRGMRLANSVPTHCDGCGCELDHDPVNGNVYGAFATMCAPCVDDCEPEHYDAGDALEMGR